MTMEKEIWRAHPEYAGIQVSTLGRVRTLDKFVSNGRGTYLVKGRVLKHPNGSNGYPTVGITIDGKCITKSVHRLVAQTFIPNPDNFQYVNHKNCNRSDNRVSNLEWCTASYNRQYQEKFGKAQGMPVFAVNLSTLEAHRFNSQSEASRELGVSDSHISAVIKGKRKQAGGYYFKEDNGNGIEIDKDKLNDIVADMNFTGGVFAVNLNTLEVSRFNSQTEASRELGVDRPNIYKVIKGKYKQTGGFFFVNADENADDIIKRKLQEIKKNKVSTLQS